MRITRGTKAFLDTSVEADFESGYSQVQQWWDRLFDQKQSNGRAENYVSNEQTIALEEWAYGAERELGNTSHIVFQKENKRYQAALRIEVDHMKDDLYGLYQDDIVMLGRSAGRWKNKLAKTFLQGATSILGRDGANFFSTAHPTRAGDSSGSNQSNLFTSTALTFDNFNTVCAGMRGLLAPNGEPYDEFGTDIVLVVPPQLAIVAKQIVYGDAVIRSSTQSGSGSLFGAVSNPLVNEGMSVLVVNDLANESGTWYVADVGGAKPCKMQVREEPTLRSHTPETDSTLDLLDNFLYTMKGRGLAVGTRWQKIARAAA